MRTLAITQNITLDGSIEMLGDWFDAENQDEDMLAVLRQQQDQADALLTGRQTFEDMRGYWPLQTDDKTGVTAYLNQVQKYVVSSTLTDPEWENATMLAGNPAAAVRALKEEPGGDIVVTGSITLCHTLIPAGLVDEYRLFTYPTVQGRGRRLFPDGFEQPQLKLLDVRRFGNGITFASYTTAWTPRDS
jgi:dihydrofolate reductase